MLIFKLLKSYRSRIKKYKLSKTAATSGLTCIMFFSTLPVLNTISKQACSRMIDYVLLYLLVDYRLDDPNVPIIEKREFMLNLLTYSDKLPKYITKLYSNLISTAQQGELFFPVLLTTADSLLVQYSVEHTPSDLFNICVNKGGSSVLAGYRLIYEPASQREVSNDQLFILGACVQLLDDIVDCSADLREGIRTIATYCLSEYNYLDHCALVLYVLTCELQEPLSGQRRLMQALLAFSIRRSRYFSPDLRARLGLKRYKNVER